MKILEGQIWLVKKGFLAGTSLTAQIKRMDVGAKPQRDRKIFIEQGEYIEMRYQTPWHFRTEDDNYFQSDETTIQENCECIGRIWERVAHKNTAKLHEILRLELYDKEEE